MHPSIGQTELGSKDTFVVGGRFSQDNVVDPTRINHVIGQGQGLASRGSLLLVYTCIGSVTLTSHAMLHE